MSNSPQISFANSSEVESWEAETVIGWGKTLVVAPHPDDESLGCGGAVALLRKFGNEVSVLTVSDGALSHPNSKKFPSSKLRDLRESETIAALEILGVSADKITFLRFPDGCVPGELSDDFAAAVTIVRDYLAETLPQTILIPWRRDPHPDHLASWKIVKAAFVDNHNDYRVLEYPIWLWERAENADLPREENIKIRRLKIDKATVQKQAAIRAHASQTTDLIDDDPSGFQLSAEVLAHFNVPFEIYFEEIK
ncbi:MAG: PIG-L deacetylase family protein [Pyrinomonadaceae bacterium]